MTETLTTLLQWLIPSGSLGAVALWLTSRTVRNTRTAKEVHNTYKVMYEDVQKTLTELRSDNERLYNAITGLRKAIARASLCRHWNTCPVRHELRYAEKTDLPPYGGKNPEAGQYHIRNPGVESGDDPGIEGEPGDTDEKPP